MAGHSKFKNIMHRKGAQDAKRAKIFAKHGKELTVAVKMGGGNTDPETNPRLRLAITSARASNMPKDNIERAIKKGAGNDDDSNFEEMRYEGYGPGGVAVIVEALTDNRNRTASEVRSTFSKYGGNLGETGSVSFMFDRVGEIVYDKGDQDFDAWFEKAIEAGADDVEEEDGFVIMTTEATQLHAVLGPLTSSCGEPKQAELVWRPTTMADMDSTLCERMVKLVDILEDSDDVQKVHTNANWPE